MKRPATSCLKCGVKYRSTLESIQHYCGNSKPKRETAQERDERIVAEAGPWSAKDFQGPLYFGEVSDGVRAIRSATRILNRIAKKRRGK